MDSDQSNDIDNLIGPITIDFSDMGTLQPGYGAVPPQSVMISAGSGAYDIGLTTPNVYITDSTFDWTGVSIANPKPSGTISLQGEDADISINGESLMDMIRGIQDRLNILCPDPEMESEWDELKALREQYEAKLAECREKSKMWKTLKS